MAVKKVVNYISGLNKIYYNIPLNSIIKIIKIIIIFKILFTLKF